MNKVAIVTGGSRGIGRAIARRLARDGVRTVLAARGAGALDAVVGEITAAGGAAAALPLDLGQPEAPARLAAFAVQTYGRIDIVVNNAGATKRADFDKLAEEDWQDGFALKFFGAVRLTRAAWPHLKAAAGSLLNIAGVGGRTPGPQFALGGAVNAALLSFTKAMADVGVRDGVQVNAINPGTVRTDRMRLRLASLTAEAGVDPAEAERRLVESTRVTRIGEPEDIANFAAFVLSPAGRFIHGALLDMDGGATKTL